MHRLLSVALTVMLMSGLCVDAFGLAEETVGPVDKVYPQQDWAGGLTRPLENPSRVYSLWVNGNENFYFDADSEQLTELISAYSEMRLRDHVVRIVSGEPFVNSFKGQAFGYNVNLHVLSGIALWHTKSTSKEPLTFEPVLTIYVSTNDERRLVESYSWPKSVVIENEVEGLDLQSGTKRPARKLMHAAVNFENGKPACDFEAGMTTTLTLWEKNQDVGFHLGKVSHDGKFSAPFSLNELSRMKTGDMWLTMTVGNYLVKASPDHPRLMPDDFAFQAKDAKPVTVARSLEYHGRILFEDGSPPTMDPEPWPGAEIHLSFPFAGRVKPDREGRFRLTLTESQLKELRARKPSQNVYVPLYGTQGRSRALHQFPIDRLSTDIENVKVFRIPRPQPPSGK